MKKHRDITLERIEKFLQRGQFDDVNIRPFLRHLSISNSITLSKYSVPDLERIPFDKAIQNKFEKCEVGVSYGPSWSTHWFKLEIEIPSEMDGQNIYLEFDPGCEALVWSDLGEPLMGITGGWGGDRHVDFDLRCNKAGQKLVLFVEVAANGMFGEGNGGMINPPDPNRYKRLDRAELVVYNEDALHVFWDLEALWGLAKEMSSETQISNDCLFAANEIVNIIRKGDLNSIKEARKYALEFFKKHEHTGITSHEISAVGNCHIDTAWLWPYDETKRKSARSWATQIRFMEQYPEYKFAASQMQQFEWTEQLYPSLFKKIQGLAEKGSFIPIGGTWVEMDCNIPSGESFCRQFLYGQRYLKEKFGRTSKVFWLPDTFGYSAQLPQIIKSAGMKYFFTQKLSWNNINKFPHTSFYWKGLDGTSVLTHFSPADTYTAQASARDVTFMVKNNKDKLYSNKSLLLYGNGDGGGGPLRPMMERIRRFQSLEGMGSVVKHEDPEKFYDRLEIESKGLNTWKGELYFELHRGTYTSHGLIKKGNRISEYLLRLVELLSSLCLITNSEFDYPKDELDRMWKLVLLNQFHDVLPGSSIGMVYDDALKFYADVATTAEVLIKKAKSFLCSKADNRMPILFNPTSWSFKNQVVEIEPVVNTKYAQLSKDGTKAIVQVSDVPAFGFGSTVSSLDLSQHDVTGSATSDHSFDDFVVVNASSGNTVVENGLIKVTFNKSGQIVSLIDATTLRKVIIPEKPGNVFQYYEDIPLFWDAWDVEIYHLEKGWPASTGTLNIEERGPIRVVLAVEHPISKTSTLKQKIIINKGSRLIQFENELDWNENRQILKVLFPVEISHDMANYETQFGVLQRPTHANNSWDMAKFEVCGHKFVDYSEFGYGIALLNDCKFGFSVSEGVLSMSILRAPKAPDMNCDIGKHTFRYALYPHLGNFEQSNVVQAAYQFNVPLISLDGIPFSKADSIFSVSDSNIVIDTIKRSEVNNHTFVFRVYEALGGRGTAVVKSAIAIQSVKSSNVLEAMLENLDISQSRDTFKLTYTPFQVLTVLITFEKQAP